MGPIRQKEILPSLFLAMDLNMITVEDMGVHIVRIQADALYDDAIVLNVHRGIDGLLDSQPVQSLLLDFSHVNSTGSAGLSMLVRLKMKCEQLGCGLGLCGLSRTVREVLQITNLDKLFRIYDRPSQFIHEAGPRY